MPSVTSECREISTAKAGPAGPAFAVLFIFSYLISDLLEIKSSGLQELESTVNHHKYQNQQNAEVNYASKTLFLTHMHSNLSVKT